MKKIWLVNSHYYVIAEGVGEAEKLFLSKFNLFIYKIELVNTQINLII